MNYRSLAKLFSLSISVFLLFYVTSSCAIVVPNYPFHYPHFYLGLTLGYGETTWNELDSDDYFVTVSVPKESDDYGNTWGGFIGYQFGRYFALEAKYRRYPNTRITLDDFSFYYPLKAYTTHTQVFSSIGKFILPLANSRINAFIDAGVAFTHRNDVLAKVTRVAPSFGLGFSSNASRRVIATLGFEYYIGYGKSEHMPLDDFVPFLFGVYFSLGYRLL